MHWLALMAALSVPGTIGVIRTPFGKTDRETLPAAFAHRDELGDAPAVTGLLQARLLAEEVPGGRRVIA